MCISLSHSINDNESCADLLLERMDNVSINGADKSGRYNMHIMKGMTLSIIEFVNSGLQFMLLLSTTMWSASNCCYDDLLLLMCLITRGKPL